MAHAIPIVGHSNKEAAELGEVVVVALPANGLPNTLPDVREACKGKVVVSTVVPLHVRRAASLHAAAASGPAPRRWPRSCPRPAW